MDHAKQAAERAAWLWRKHGAQAADIEPIIAEAIDAATADLRAQLTMATQRYNEWEGITDIQKQAIDDLRAKLAAAEKAIQEAYDVASEGTIATPRRVIEILGPALTKG
jgi:hypothetical protein